jgi:hypothetical protein
MLRLDFDIMHYVIGQDCKHWHRNGLKRSACLPRPAATSLYELETGE